MTTCDQSHPWIDIKPNGTVDVVWYDKRGDPLDQNLEVFFAALLPGAPGFIPNVPISTAPIPQPGSGWWVGDFNGLVVDNQFAHMVWNDTRRDGALGDIYYAAMENPMFEPVGACCLPSGECTELTSLECNAQGGSFKVEGLDCSMVSCVSAVGPPVAGRHLAFMCAPNPFNPTTVISYDLQTQTPVRVDLFDIRGRHLRSLVDLPLQSQGRHEIVWDGRDGGGQMVAAGVYFARLHAGGQVANIRMALIK